MDVSSYWLPSLGVLLDPLAVPEEVDKVGESSSPTATTCVTRSRLASASGPPSTLPRAGAHEFDDGASVEFYDFEKGSRAEPSPPR